MKNFKFLKPFFFIVMVFFLLSFDIPSGWFVAGSKPDSYEIGIAKDEGYGGGNAATIKSIEDNIDGFGTLMQKCIPGDYLGERIRMSGYIKTKDVNDWAGFWLRIDKQEEEQALSFDNMRNRNINGTNDWKMYEIVVDVPLYATDISFGILLSGEGQIWVDSLKFEIVDDSIQTTGTGNQHLIPNKKPLNLDFEKFF